MKKWTYIVGGFALGLVVALTTNTAYGAVQSLVGKKVTGEMTVIVNGTKLQDKGAVIEGKTNAPVRALIDALGADLKVDGKTIYVTSIGTTQDKTIVIDGKYYTKIDLLNKKKSIEDNLTILTNNYEAKKKEYEEMKASGKIEAEQVYLAGFEDAEKKIKSYNDELDKINEALEQFE